MERIMVHSMAELETKTKEGWMVESVTMIRNPPTSAGRVSMTIDDSKIHVIPAGGKVNG